MKKKKKLFTLNEIKEQMKVTPKELDYIMKSLDEFRQKEGKKND
jgi:hypothetical protein